MLRARGVSKLEKERRRRELTTTDLAREMGVSRSEVSRVENGWLVPSPAFKAKAAKALGLSPQAVFPEYFFLAHSDRAGVHLAGANGRTLAFSTKRQASEAAAKLEPRIGRRPVLMGPAPLAFFAVMRGVDTDEILSEIDVDPEIRDLAEDRKDEDPAGEPGLVTASTGLGGGDDSG